MQVEKRALIIGRFCIKNTAALCTTSGVSLSQTLNIHGQAYAAKLEAKCCTGVKCNGGAASGGVLDPKLGPVDVETGWSWNLRDSK